MPTNIINIPNSTDQTYALLAALGAQRRQESGAPTGQQSLQALLDRPTPQNNGDIAQMNAMMQLIALDKQLAGQREENAMTRDFQKAQLDLARDQFTSEKNRAAEYEKVQLDMLRRQDVDSALVRALTQFSELDNEARMFATYEPKMTLQQEMQDYQLGQQEAATNLGTMMSTLGGIDPANATEEQVKTLQRNVSNAATRIQSLVNDPNYSPAAKSGIVTTAYKTFQQVEMNMSEAMKNGWFGTDSPVGMQLASHVRDNILPSLSSTGMYQPGFLNDKGRALSDIDKSIMQQSSERRRTLFESMNSLRSAPGTDATAVFRAANELIKNKPYVVPGFTPKSAPYIEKPIMGPEAPGMSIPGMEKFNIPSASGAQAAVSSPIIMNPGSPAVAEGWEDQGSLIGVPRRVAASLTNVFGNPGGVNLAATGLGSREGEQEITDAVLRAIFGLPNPGFGNVPGWSNGPISGLAFAGIPSPATLPARQTTLGASQQPQSLQNMLSEQEYAELVTSLMGNQ